MRRNLGFASLSVGFRGSAQIALVAILARFLSVEQFGLFTLGLAVATILGLVADYGFATLLLRDLAAGDQDIGARIGAAAVGKLVLSAGGGLVLLAAAQLPETTAAEMQVVSLLFLAQIVGSFGTLMLVPFKCRDRYDVEAGWTLVEAIAIIGSSAVAAHAYGTAIAAAEAYAVGRLLFLVGTAISYGTTFPLALRFRQAFRELRAALPFGVHLFVGNAYLNLDTVLLRQFVSLDSIGLYQAGIRMVVVVSMFLGVVNSVLIPRLASDLVRDPAAFRVAARRSILAVSGVGLLVGLPMILAADTCLTILYGHDYSPASTLVAILGAVVIVRFFGAVYGILLTVSGHQTLRAVAAFLTLSGLGAADLWVIPRFGTTGAASVLLAAHVALVAAYVIFTKQEYGVFFLRRPTVSP